MTGFDFNARPFVVIWEVTRACSLVCRHCRASAKVHRHPLELLDFRQRNGPGTNRLAAPAAAAMT